MIVMVCCTPHFSDKKKFTEAMDLAHKEVGIEKVVITSLSHGEDLAEAWAEENNIELEEYPTRWYYGDYQKPGAILMFGSDKGMTHIKTLAKTAKIKTVKIK